MAVRRATVRGVGGVLALALLMSCGGAGGARTDAGAGGGAGWAVERSYANEGVEVLLRLDRSEITTAEWARLEVAALAPEGLAVRLPAAQQAEAGGLQVAQTRTSPPALQEDGRVRWVRRFELRPFLAGEYEVPGLVVAAGEPGAAAGAAAEVRTEALALSVASVLPAGEEAPALREVEGPLPVPPPAGRVLLFVALAAAVAGAAVTGVILLRRRAARARAQAAVVPPHEAALRALRELAAGGLLQRDLLAFHTAVAAVVRRYLEQRFGVRAPQRTTEELLLILAAASWLDDVQRRALRAFLAQCDQVKFARARPAAAASERLIDTAVDLVTATRPTDAEAADAADAAPNAPGPPAAEAARAV